MSERSQNREAAFFRRCFLFMLIAGLLGLTAGTVLFIFEDVSLFPDDAECMSLYGVIWFCAGTVGLLATTVMIKRKWKWTIRLSSGLLILLCFAWSGIFAISQASRTDIDDIVLGMTCFAVLIITWIIFVYLLVLETRTPMQEIMQKVLAWSVLTCTLAGLLFYVLEMWYLVSWLLPVLAVWDLLSLMGVGVLQTMIRQSQQPRGSLVRTIPLRARLTMTCPSCGEWQALPSGPARCDACGFRMIIKIQEPRCECGYLLYRLAGRVCPECGRPVEVVSSPEMGDVQASPAGSS